ncbi:MAG TPA: transposase [Pirellulales bacterium]|nr:transposase [Pirellulales bacterium]
MLVKAHCRATSSLAAGVGHAANAQDAWAATQAAWRFFKNERVTLEALVEPLREAGRHALTDEGQRSAAPACALLVHDWSKVDYGSHTSKRDVTQLTHEADIGYELTTALLVDADDGSPLAPMEMHLKTKDGLLSTRNPAPSAGEYRLEQVFDTMQASHDWGLSVPLVHIIDREADSVGHYRQWHAAGHRFLVRGDDRKVRWDERRMLLSEIASQLAEAGKFRRSRAVEIRGQKATQYVAETEVVLDQPARQKRDGRKQSIPGPPLTLRLIVVRVLDDDGKQLAEWLLLTNVPAEWADRDRIALWYYWRWRIESFFKLLKSGGQQLEHWLQETAAGIFRRLLVASMACVVAWRLERQTTPEAEELKRVLVKLSGRQMKRSRRVTAPALLAGLCVLLSFQALLDDYHIEDIQRLLSRAMPQLDTT